MTLILLIYLLAPVAIIFAFQRFKLAQKIGTIILAYAVGIVLALTGAVEFEGPDAVAFDKIQRTIMNLTVPLAIPLMLFNVDFKLWTRSLPKTIWAFVAGIVSVIVAIVSGFFIFRNSGVAELNNVAGLMMGIYSGGTVNFFALGEALSVNPETIVFVYAFEMVVTFPFVIFIASGGYKLFRRFLPFASQTDDQKLPTNNVEISIESYSGMLQPRIVAQMAVALLIAVAFAGVGAGLSLLITGKLSELVVILTVTTLAIAASFVKKIRTLPKTFELGMVFILMFSVVVASQFDITTLYRTSHLLYFILYIMVVSIVLHLLLCRLFKVEGDLFTVASVGLLCSPPFVPPIVSAIKNPRMLISGVVIGLAGYAVGTYLGIAIASILK